MPRAPRQGVLACVGDDHLAWTAQLDELLHEVTHEARTDDDDVVAERHVGQLDGVDGAGQRLTEREVERDAVGGQAIVGRSGDVLREAAARDPRRHRVTDPERRDLGTNVLDDTAHPRARTWRGKSMFERPSHMSTSDAQTPQFATRISTSWGPVSGTGSSSTAISRGARRTAARTVVPFGQPSVARVVRAVGRTSTAAPCGAAWMARRPSAPTVAPAPPSRSTSEPSATVKASPTATSTATPSDATFRTTSAVPPGPERR
jgi:hypothetical protein